MPKSTVSRKKLFREFSKIDNKYIQENGMKNLHFMYNDAKQNYELGRAELEFMFFVYDLEFFTIDYLSKAMKKSKTTVARRLVYKLLADGWLYKHFDKLTSARNDEQDFFREEHKFNYRVRYALSQKGRMMVARMYRKMRGDEAFRTSSYDELHP